MKLQGYEIVEINYIEGGNVEDARIECFGDVEHYSMVMKNGFDGYKSRIMQEVEGEPEYNNLYLGFIEKMDHIIAVTKVKKLDEVL